MKKIINYLIVLVAVVFTNCEVGNFDLQDDPNRLTPENADTNALLNEMQFLFQDILADMESNTERLMRYRALTSSYGDAVSGDILNLEWERFFEVLFISRTIDNRATSNSDFAFHNGISKLLRAYLTITFVDFNGKIPYEQAVNVSEFPNPKLDEGAELYKTALTDITSAISDINSAAFNVTTDLFYQNDKDKWIAFANTLKLRILIQAKDAAPEIGMTDLKGEINTLLASNIIDTPEEDFVYKYAEVPLPESRHPYFISGYLPGGFNRYIGNTFMNALINQKSVRDPRLRYYLYRPTNIDPLTARSSNPYLGCLTVNDFSGICYVGDQYWGLDHGDNLTGRGDNLFRTVYGIYPGGGAFDEDQKRAAASTSNLAGAGILPILTSSYVKFLIGEAALTIGTNGDAKTLLKEAIEASMTKVTTFGGVTSSKAATTGDIDAYVNEALSNYDAASSDNDRLDVVITELYFAAFGYSIEAYNAYRRTGYPSFINNDPIDVANSIFPRSFPYALDEVNTNSSITQKANSDKIFWDKNPDGFIK